MDANPNAEIRDPIAMPGRPLILVTDWIADFDVELPVAPFTFELDVPDDLIPAAVPS